MKKVMMLATLAVAVQVFLLGVVAAQKNTIQTKTGIVTKVDTSARQVVVRVAQGLVFTVTESTSIMLGNKPQNLTDIKVGSKVTVEYSHHGDIRTALRIAIPTGELRGEPAAKEAGSEIKTGNPFTIQFPEMPPTFYDLSQKQNLPAQMTVCLPKNYDPRRKHPLLVFLNGGDGGTGTELGVARSLTKDTDFVSVSVPLFRATDPNAPGANYVMIDADGEYMWPFFKTMLEKLAERVPNIDPSHQILGGSSNGAHAASALMDSSAGEVARRFSAILFVEGGGKLHHYELLKGKPFLIVSSNAKSQPRAEEICDAAKAAGAKASIIVENVGKHDFPVSAYPAVREWLRGPAME